MFIKRCVCNVLIMKLFLKKGINIRFNKVRKNSYVRIYFLVYLKVGIGGNVEVLFFF